MSKRIRQHAPNDTELHKIADTLVTIQRKWFYGIVTTITTRGHYSHEYTMQFDHCHTTDCELPSSVTDDIEETFRDLARWYYSQLEKEYDYLSSDEVIAEHLEANDCEFDELGNPS
jgi:hypothetical protein